MPNDRTLIFVRANSPGFDETEWNDWYEKQHIAARLEIPGFLCIRRFRLSDGQTSNPASLMAPTYLALYEVDHPDVLSSAPYVKVVKHEASLGSDSFDVEICFFNCHGLMVRFAISVGCQRCRVALSSRYLERN